MSETLERQVLAQVLSDYAGSAVIPVNWPNRVFDKPLSGPWMRFTVIDAKSNQVETGSSRNTNRVLGSLIIQIFVPDDTGDGQALEIAQEVGSAYRQKVLNFPDGSGLVRTRNPTVRGIGVSDSFYQVNVSIPFHRDDLP